MLWWPEPALDIEQGLSFALWLSLPCQGQGLFPNCWSRGPQICFLAVFLICVVRYVGLDHSHWEGSHWVFPFWNCSHVSVLHCVHFHPMCGCTNYTVVGTAFSLTLTMCMPAIVLVDSQALLSPGYWHRSTEVRSQDCSSHRLQLMLWPGPTPMCMCP